MKKKIIVASLAIALVAIAVAGTLAWFNDTDEVTNVFTVGSVDIEQKEVFDEDTAQLLPVLGLDPTVATDNYIEKKVTVANIGKNDAYVQTYVAVPAVLDNHGVLKLYDGDLATKGWTKVGKSAENVTIEGEQLLYNVYLYRYNNILPVENNNETTACLEYVYIDSTIDLNAYDKKDAEGNPGTDGVKDTAYFVLEDGTEITDFDATGRLNIYVATQGVQAKGFSDAEEALTSAFQKHPWETQ